MTEEKMTHSDGPWEIFPNRSMYVIQNHDTDIAQVENWDSTKEELANATLIAAAPDLLAACEAILAGIDWGLFDGDSKDPAWYKEQVVDAVRKATLPPCPCCIHEHDEDCPSLGCDVL